MERTASSSRPEKSSAETGGYFSNPALLAEGGPDRHSSSILSSRRPRPRGRRGPGRKKSVLSDGYWGRGRPRLVGRAETKFSSPPEPPTTHFKIYARHALGPRAAGTALESAGGSDDPGRRKRRPLDHQRATTTPTRCWFSAPDEHPERDLSWLDLSDAQSLTPDGRRSCSPITAGAAGGANYSTCLRQTDGSPVVRLGDGAAGGISRRREPRAGDRADLARGARRLSRRAPGEPRRLERGGLVSYETARLFSTMGGACLRAATRRDARCAAMFRSVRGGAPRAV